MKMITLVKNVKLNEEENLVLAVCEGIGELNQEYVTWRTTTPGNYYWGHYHLTIDEALEDFNKRLKEK